MIQIEDDDMPIDVAAKLVTGKKANKTPEQIKELVFNVTGKRVPSQRVMYTSKELLEIADYLYLFCKTSDDYPAARYNLKRRNRELYKNIDDGR